MDEPKDEVGQALAAALAALDDLVVLANRADTRQRLCEEKRLLGKIITDCQLLGTFAMAVKSAPMMVVNRG